MKRLYKNSDPRVRMRTITYAAGMAAARDKTVTIAPSSRLVQKAEIIAEFWVNATYQRNDQLAGGNDRICSPLNEMGITSNTGARRKRNRTKTRIFIGTEVWPASISVSY